MGLANIWAQYKICHSGVKHITLNPEGPGAVRIHLVPPRFHPLRPVSYVVILNGYYILPLGYSWAILLERLMETVEPFDGRPMGQAEMDACLERAVTLAQKVFPLTSRKLLAADLRELLDGLFTVARGEVAVGGSQASPMSLRQYAPQMTAPHRMDLLVSAMSDPQGQWSCNLHCRHCYAANQPQAGTAELSTAQWKQIIDRCRAANIPMLTFTGGEPTLRGDLPELISHARWFVTRLNTNGLLLTPELCQKLREASLDSVQLTLYSHDAAIHNELVGAGEAGGWAETVAGLRNALEAGLDVSVNTPLCRDNADYTQTLLFLRDSGVRFVSCSGLIETGKAAAPGSLSSQLDTPEMDALLSSAAAFCGEQGMELSFTSPGRATPALLRELGLAVPACGACLSNMAVAPDGTVVPCQSWLGGGDRLGNMLTHRWEDVWNAPLCAELRAMDDDASLHCPLRKRTGGTPNA